MARGPLQSLRYLVWSGMNLCWPNSIQNKIYLIPGYGRNCTSNRWDEKLWSEVYLGLQRGGGHHPGGGWGERDGVSEDDNDWSGILIFVFRSCVSHASIEENEANFAGIRARGDKEFTGEENIRNKLVQDRPHCINFLPSSTSSYSILFYMQLM